MGGLKDAHPSIDLGFEPSRNQSPRDGRAESPRRRIRSRSRARVAISLPEMGGLKEYLAQGKPLPFIRRNQSPRDGRAESVEVSWQGLPIF